VLDERSPCPAVGTNAVGELLFKEGVVAEVVFTLLTPAMSVILSLDATY
jgi:hypothetical protein